MSRGGKRIKAYLVRHLGSGRQWIVSAYSVKEALSYVWRTAGLKREDYIQLRGRVLPREFLAYVSERAPFMVEVSKDGAESSALEKQRGA